MPEQHRHEYPDCRRDGVWFTAFVFEKTVVLFEDYYRLMDREERPGFARDLAVEVQERLRQLDYLLRRVEGAENVLKLSQEASVELAHERMRRLEEEGLSWESDLYPIPLMSQEDVSGWVTATFEARLFTECFYYVAGHIRTILQSRSRPLPGLHRFEAKGVRTVRNKLLEHAGEGDNVVTVSSFGFGGPNGPGVKAVRPNDQVGTDVDEGLYANAKEFREALERRLRRELGILK